MAVPDLAAPPAVGDFAPDFVLPDSAGAERRLSQLVAAQSQVLVFFRGAW